ncbi:thioesterase family protein [Massilia sp. LC238]|uniref:acyl-CoA thioesterase n=1 Tax=Massilia sp. LC238 TaxID=1502852 RepID=UPI0004E3D0DF|nr:thioesterase family protein [Massilia sp. LC238]KFC75760.1 YbgC/YbaW family acyl-CoA thioester hydrolase [Massilia sp. LC238]
MSNKQFVHSMRIPIRWGDMDAMGHVNNTVYFRYIESARIAWLEQSGALADPAASTEGPVVVNAYCSFLKQLTYPGEIEVTTYVGPPGRSSIEVTHEIRLVSSDGQAGALHAEGGAKVVWIDFKAEKSRPLPERLRALLPSA